jgi:hypothetical protein
VSLSSDDEVPHIFTRKSRLQPGEFLISSAKRLLQQYLPKADIKPHQRRRAESVDSELPGQCRHRSGSCPAMGGSHG